MMVRLPLQQELLNMHKLSSMFIQIDQWIHANMILLINKIDNDTFIILKDIYSHSLDIIKITFYI